LELSIEIFAYLWDKEFIWIKLPLSSGGNNESKYRNSRDALRVQLGFFNSDSPNWLQAGLRGLSAFEE
jgi:hypothetical protein